VSRAFVLAAGCLGLAFAAGCRAPRGNTGAEVVPAPPARTNGAPSLAHRLTHLHHWDEWHGELGSNIVDVVERFDRHFGEARLNEETRGTRVKVSLGFSYDGDDGLSFENKINARLALPALEHRLQLVVDNFVEADDPDRISPILDAARESEPDAALRLVSREAAKWRINTDAGVRFSDELQVFGKFRGSRTLVLQPWEMNFSQEFKWYSDNGWSEISELRWSRIVAWRWLFRSTTSVSWEEDSEGVTPSQSFAIFKQLSKRRAFKLATAAAWPEFPHTVSANYKLEASHRQLIHKDWLFMEITPGVEFPQKDNYNVNPYITVLFDCIFGDAR
jgi:hypothetical protein